jgi:DNA-binding NarL/FixJ family response regulator
MQTNVRGASGVNAPGRRSKNGCVDSSHVSDAEVLEPGPVVSGVQKTIVIIGERALFRDCLAKGLTAGNGNFVTATFSSVAEWQKAAALHSALSVIVLCCRSSATTDIQRELSRLSSVMFGVPIVLLSEAEDMEHVLVALDHGARGYLPTSVTLEVAVEALHLVGAGATFVPASCLLASRSAPTELDLALRSDGAFTARESEVLAGLRQGKANKRIAYDLNMKENTVKVHVRNIMKKLRARNRTEVAFLTQGMFQCAQEG